MIVRDPPNHFRLFFIMQGSIVPRIAPLIGVVAIFSLCVLLVDRHLLPLPHVSFTATGIFGLALSLFLGFRNNAAYERWWEARRLWGQLIADMRSLGRETDLFVEDLDTRQQLIRHALFFIHLHRISLRNIDTQDAPRKWAPPGAPEKNLPETPCEALNAATRLLREAARAGHLDGFGRKALSERLAAISLAQAGCERIRNTPLPFVYSLLVLRTSWLYCLAVPFALIDSAGPLAPLFAAVIAYVFFGLAAVTEELEHPFAAAPNALPLDTMCRTVEIALVPRLGEEPPGPLQASNGLLT